MTLRTRCIYLIGLVVLVLFWLIFGFFSGRFSTQIGAMCSVFFWGAGLASRNPSFIVRCWLVLIAVIGMCFIPWDIGIRRADKFTVAVQSAVILKRNAANSQDLIYTGHGIASLPAKVFVIYLPTEVNIMTPFGFAIR